MLIISRLVHLLSGVVIGQNSSSAESLRLFSDVRANRCNVASGVTNRERFLGVPSILKGVLNDLIDWSERS